MIVSEVLQNVWVVYVLFFRTGQQRGKKHLQILLNLSTAEQVYPSDQAEIIINLWSFDIFKDKHETFKWLEDICNESWQERIIILDPSAKPRTNTHISVTTQPFTCGNYLLYHVWYDLKLTGLLDQTRSLQEGPGTWSNEASNDEAFIKIIESVQFRDACLDDLQEHKRHVATGIREDNRAARDGDLNTVFEKHTLHILNMY